MENRGKDRIHFLNTGHSDCILLESSGHFALVDAAEDNDFPADKPHLALKGYEDEVVNYLLQHCRGENGLVTLDFIVATHAHSDHIGGFDTVLLHPEIRVQRAYVRKYTAENVFFIERRRWDNQEVYDQMLEALQRTNTPVEQDFNGKSFSLGNFKITLLHGKAKKRLVKFGENINSVVTLVEKDGARALLAGDMNYKAGDERRIADRVGKVSLLKVGHHGYFGSTSAYFVQKLCPQYAVITNTAAAVFPDVKYKLTRLAHAEIHTTADEDGVLADFDGSGKITLHSHIM